MSLQITLKTKLLAGFGAMAAVALLVSATSVHSLAGANARFTDYLSGAAQREQLAVEIRGAANARAVAARNLVLVTSGTDREVEKALVTAAHDKVQASFRQLQAALDAASDITPRERELFAQLKEVEASYGPVALDIVGLALAGKHDEAIAKMNAECRPLLARLLASTAAMVEQTDARGRADVASAASAYRADRALLLALCAMAVLGGAALAWLLSMAVTRPLARAVTLAEAVAAGDLRTRIDVTSTDETGKLLAALKAMNGSLVTMVDGVRQSADGIATASSQIASGNQDLSSRTEEQANALQQTASSMAQMTSTVQNNAATSSQASQLASAAADVAGKGGAVVDRVIATMGEISASSRKINDIIGVIDGIAFQTNILALNAAVEAARAGEHGRGFAVVAAEVRTLSQRSAEAAKEIKLLIARSVEKVEAGNELVDEAGQTMKDIVQQVRRVTDLIAEINAATTEQSSGIREVNDAIVSIDQGTQQNAALVEESAAATESLRQQASVLLESIARFKTLTA